MNVLFFGSYDPSYARNRVILKGLRENGVEVTECNERSRSLAGIFRLIGKYLKERKNFDIMLVPFPGQEIMILARMLTRKPIVFDVFTSHYGGYILDRQKYGKHSLHAAWYRFLDRISCNAADLVLLDTETHIDFFVREFGLPKAKFRRLFVGSDTDVHKPFPAVAHEDFQVHFHGHYIPLQGAEVIIHAAAILKNEGIHFTMIGRGQTYNRDRKLAGELKADNIEFIDSVPYAELPSYIAKADVCLGIFGTSSKTQLVIPNKVFEALACAKPVITADTPAIRELLTEGEDVLLCQAGNPKDLADKILELKNNSGLREKLGSNGFKILKEKATPKILGEELVGYLNSL